MPSITQHSTHGWGLILVSCAGAFVGVNIADGLFADGLFADGLLAEGRTAPAIVCEQRPFTQSD